MLFDFIFLKKWLNKQHKLQIQKKKSGWKSKSHPYLDSSKANASVIQWKQKKHEMI